MDESKMMEFQTRKIRLEQEAEALFPKHAFDVQRLRGDLYPNIDIPACKTKKYEIAKHLYKTGEKIDVVNIRDAIYMRLRPITMILSSPYEMTILKNGKTDGVMMATHPQEIFQQHIGYDNAFGNVLVGGLGLGYIATKIAEKPTVKSVTVVEIDKQLIDLVWPHLKKHPNFNKLKIINADLFKYLKTAPKEFNYGYFDIWYGRGGEGDYCDNVIPLRILAHKCFGDDFKMNCWAEETMKYQVMQSCATAFLMRWFDFTNYSTYKLHYVFGKSCSKNWFESIDYFLNNVGTSAWCRRWQWLKGCKERRKQCLKEKNV